MKKQVSLYAVAAIGASLIWCFLAYLPLKAKQDNLRRKTEEVRRQLTDYSRTTEELPAFLKANQNLETRRGELNSSLFAKSDILDLFRQINEDASDHNLELVEISPPVSELLELNRQATIDNEPQFLNIRLDFKGCYVDFGRYLSGLESKPYFRTVNACVIRGNQLVQPTVDLTVSFKALIGMVEVVT